jgi:hypothetical protein
MRSQRARWKHGLYSAEARAEQKRVRELLTQSRELLKQMQAGSTGGFTGAWGTYRQSGITPGGAQQPERKYPRFS